MRQADFLARVVHALDSVGVPYFITGSIASSMYGEPRFTADVDIVIDLKLNQVDGLIAQFPSPDYYVSGERARQAVIHGGSFNVIHGSSGNKADLIVPPREAFQFARMRRARTSMTPKGVSLRLASPEDVILSKLLFYREGGPDKHLRDITGILRAGQVTLDMDYIGRWVEQWDMTELWGELLKVARGDNNDER